MVTINSKIWKFLELNSLSAHGLKMSLLKINNFREKLVKLLAVRKKFSMEKYVH